jgi:hypothetical protein
MQLRKPKEDGDMACTSQVKVTYKKGRPDAFELICAGDCPDKKTCEPTPNKIDPKKLTRQFCACPTDDEPEEPTGCHIVLYTDPKKKDIYFKCEGNKCNPKETCAAVPAQHHLNDDGTPDWILFECRCLSEDEFFPLPK